MDSNDADVYKLIKDIKTEREKGFGFLPLIGAGLSVASGIPAIPQLRRYLAVCIARSLGLDSLPLASPRRLQPKSFKTSPWPSASELAGIDLNSFENNLKNNLFKILNSDDGMFVERASRPAYQEALGALADWRSSLLFLSRLFVERDFAEKDIAKCGAPDDQVTDSFFLHVVGGKRPNLSHRMLAQLSSLLGFGTVLTVNFDELLEKAFAEAGEPLTVFDVHLSAGLPPARTVCDERSIVKLHGGRYGLRANYSLDLPPSADDQRHFVGYLCGTRIDSDTWRKNNLPPPKYHLLIAGVSASDARTRALLETALERLPDLRIFWICYFPSDPDDIRAYFPSFGPARLQVVQHTNYGLLFLHLYQSLSHCLPPSGIDFPALWQLPAPTRRASTAPDGNHPEYEGLKSNLAKSLCLDDPKKLSAGEHPKLVIVDSPKTMLGVSSVVADVYLRNETTGNFVWLDLDDCIDADEMFVWLTIAVARKAGVPDLLPYALNEDLSTRKQELMSYMSSVGGRWIVYLNGRDGFGSNAERPWNEFTKFWSLLEKLTERTPDDPDVTFVVSMHTYKDTITVQQWLTSPNVVHFQLGNTCVEFKEDRAITSVAELIPSCGPSYSFARFFYALLLLRRIRYPSILASAIVQGVSVGKGDLDKKRDELALAWIGELQNVGVIQVKQGGFAGMHRGLRQKLRDILIKSHPTLEQHAPELHQVIADWYYKLFLSSDDPMAVFESVYHRCECVKAAQDDGSLVTSALQEAVNTLRISRDVVLSRGYSESIFNCLDQLEQTIDSQNPSQPAMRKALARLRYDVAIEIGDFQRAKQEYDAKMLQASTPPKGEVIINSPAVATVTVEDLEHARLLNGLRAYETAAQAFEDHLKNVQFPLTDVRFPSRPNGQPDSPAGAEQSQYRFALPNYRAMPLINGPSGFFMGTGLNRRNGSRPRF